MGGSENAGGRDLVRGVRARRSHGPRRCAPGLHTLAPAWSAKVLGLGHMVLSASLLTAIHLRGFALNVLRLVLVHS